MRFTIAIAFSLIIFCCKKTDSQFNNTDEMRALSSSQIVDLTYEFSKETIYWVTSKEFELDTVAEGITENGFYYSANNIATAEHGGTHIDAPIHFAENQQAVNEIPLKNLIGQGIKIDVSQYSLKNRDYQIGIEDFKTWEADHQMKIPEESIVLLETGFGKFYPDKIKYLGTDQRGTEAVKELHFPGLDPRAAQWLVENRKIKAIGLDTASIDFGQSTNFESHIILLSENIPVFENLANLNKLPAKGFQVIALPMKIKDGSGGPLRIIANF